MGVGVKLGPALAGELWLTAMGTVVEIERVSGIARTVRGCLWPGNSPRRGRTRRSEEMRAQRAASRRGQNDHCGHVSPAVLGGQERVGNGACDRNLVGGVDEGARVLFIHRNDITHLSDNDCPVDPSRR